MKRYFRDACFLIFVTAAVLISGCATNHKTSLSTGNPVIGHYVATTAQIRAASVRAARHFIHMSAGLQPGMRVATVRYLAVQTESPTPTQISQIKKTIRTSPEVAAKYGLTAAVSGAGPWELKKPVYCVMIWDTESRQIIGSQCYALLELPGPGTLARFETYNAEFVSAAQ